MTKALTPEDVARLKKLFSEGVTVLQEIDDLREGLGETVKAIAEEMDVKAGNLNRAIKIAHKASFQEAQADFTEIEDLLDITGRKL